MLIWVKRIYENCYKEEIWENNFNFEIKFVNFCWNILYCCWDLYMNVNLWMGGKKDCKIWWKWMGIIFNNLI